MVLNWKKIMDFSEALRAAKSGQAIARAGWNGKGMFVYHVQGNSYPATSPVAKERFGEDALVLYGPYLAIKTATGTGEVVPWLPSQSDILAGDWDLA